MTRIIFNIKKMQEWIKGYTAGFLDGEGYIGIVDTNCNLTRAKTGRKYYTIHIQFIQKDRRVLDWLQVQWGGGKVYPVSKNTTRGAFEGWRWCLQTKAAINLLQEVLPYLKVKKEQAQIAAQFPLAEISRRKMPDSIYKTRCKLAEKMRVLKHKQKEFGFQY